MKLYFVRHGHMSATRDTALDPDVGQINEPLDDQGILQADKLAEELKDVPLEVIIASPLKRAYQTAQIINKYHALPIETDGVWRERDTAGYVTPEAWDDLFDFDKNISADKTESLNDFFQRVYDALDALKEDYADKTVLIASHGGVHQALYAYVHELPLKGNVRNDPLRNCEYRIYEL